MSNSLSPSKADSTIRIYTPSSLARLIVDHYRPSGSMLDPCRGPGAFYNAMQDHAQQAHDVHWMEIDEGRDFLDPKNTEGRHWNWIISNTPWGRLFADFLRVSLAHSDNIVFLANMNVWMTKSRLKMIREAGFGIVEMAIVPTPPKPWPQTGFALAATHLKRGWTGSTHIHELE